MKKRSNPATLGAWGERGLIRAILSKPGPRARFLVSPGDDGCVLRQKERLVLSVDGMVDGIHFKSSWASLLKKKFSLSLGRLLGEKLLLSALSDLYAMGGVARPWAMIFLGAPPSTPSGFLMDLHRGIKTAAKKMNCALAGGDTVRSPHLVLSASVGGALQTPRPLMRKAARPGDYLCVTGNLGDSSAGLDILLQRKKTDRKTAASLITGFFKPTIAVNEGRILAETSGVRGALDLSDSLHESIFLLKGKKKTSIEVNLDAAPVSAAWLRSGGDRRSLPSAAEDYGLLFSASPAATASLRKKMRFSILGKYGRRGGVRYTLNGKIIRPRNPFKHF